MTTFWRTVEHCTGVNLHSNTCSLCNLFMIFPTIEYKHLLHLKFEKSKGQVIASLHCSCLHFLQYVGSSQCRIREKNFTVVSLPYLKSNNVSNDFKVKYHKITFSYFQLQYLQVFQCKYYQLTASEVIVVRVYLSTGDMFKKQFLTLVS